MQIYHEESSIAATCVAATWRLPGIPAHRQYAALARRDRRTARSRHRRPAELMIAWACASEANDRAAAVQFTAKHSTNRDDAELGQRRTTRESPTGGRSSLRRWSAGPAYAEIVVGKAVNPPDPRVIASKHKLTEARPNSWFEARQRCIWLPDRAAPEREDTTMPTVNEPRAAEGAD